MARKAFLRADPPGSDHNRRSKDKSMIASNFYVRATFDLLVLILCVGALPRSAAALDLVNTSGFESYVLTGLAGQNSWLTSGSGGSANVQQAIALNGSKAVRVDR